MPVVVVSSRDSIVPAVLADQRRMLPVVARVLPGDDDVRAGVAQRPDIVGIDVPHTPLRPCRRRRGRPVRIVPGQSLVHTGVGYNASDVGTICHPDDERAIARHEQHVDDVEGPIGNAGRVERRPQRRLGA